jgi:hypothetical protein
MDTRTLLRDDMATPPVWPRRTAEDGVPSATPEEDEGRTDVPVAAPEEDEGRTGVPRATPEEELAPLCENQKAALKTSFF